MIKILCSPESYVEERNMSDSVRKMINIVISLLAAIIAWTFVVYNDDPMTEVTYKDVPIIFEGEAALINGDLGISEVSATTVDVRLRQMRIHTGEITADSIKIVADVSNAVEGENGISLQISGPENTQVIDASKRAISVFAEKADSVEKDIIIEYEEGNTGIEPVTTSVTSQTATVLGAESEIKRVYKVAAQLKNGDTTDRARNITTTLKAFDRDGDEISHLIIYPGEINYYAYTGITKEVPLKIVTDEPDDDYERTWRSPETIVIKGSAEKIQDVDSVSTTEIKISEMYETSDVELEYDLPDGVYLANESKGKVLRIKVALKETEEETEDGTDSET